MSLQFFTERFQQGILGRVTVLALASAAPSDKAKVSVSEKAYGEGFAEADFDATFLQTRRGLHKGLSEGKLADLLFFRLTRHKFVHLAPELVESSHYDHFQERIVIKIVSALLRIDFDDPWIRAWVGKDRPTGMRRQFQDVHGELLYLTCRRHYNQEPLALFFDTAAYLAQAISELQALKGELRTLGHA